MTVDFSEQTVLVTGAASGIGEAAALSFARAGAHVAAADRDERGAEATAREIEAEGGEASAIRVDVTDGESVAAMVEAVVERFGRLDAACNAAGVESPRVPAAELEEADWDHVTGVNLKGVWLSMKHELRRMLEQKRAGENGDAAAIVNVASAFGTVGGRKRPAYTAAKHGVVGLTRTAALDYAEEGVRVNAVCPSYIYTHLQRRAARDLSLRERHEITQTYPMGRHGDPEEVAEAILWLASEGASFVTGEALAVDGGYTAQ